MVQGSYEGWQKCTDNKMEPQGHFGEVHLIRPELPNSNTTKGEDHLRNHNRNIKFRYTCIRTRTNGKKVIGGGFYIQEKMRAEKGGWMREKQAWDKEWGGRDKKASHV